MEQSTWSKNPQTYNDDEKGYKRYASRHDSARSGPSSRPPASSAYSGALRSHGSVSDMSTAFSGININTDRSPFQIKGSDFFTRGRVFATMRQNDPNNKNSGTTVSSFLPADRDTSGGSISGVQRYVIIAEGTGGDHDYCHCLLVSTYGGQGVGKHGVVKADHGIIYSGGKRRSQPPEPQPEEEALRGEVGMCVTALRVEMRLPTEKLDRMARINYKDVYRVSKQTPVYYLGNVDRDSIPWMISQFQAVQKHSDQPSKMDEEIDEDNDSDEADNSRRMADLTAEAQQAKAAYRRLLNLGRTSDQAVATIAQMLQKQKSIKSWQEALAAARGRLRYPPNAIPGV